MYVAKIILTPLWCRKNIGGKFSSPSTHTYDRYLPPDTADVVLLVACHRIRSQIIIDEYHY
jgi:hypothetical protein